MKYANGLGLSQADIGDIDGNINLAFSTKLKLAAAFKMWKANCQKDSLPATYRSLLKVALKVNDGNGAQKICETCRQITPIPEFIATGN